MLNDNFTVADMFYPDALEAESHVNRLPHTRYCCKKSQNAFVTLRYICCSHCKKCTQTSNVFFFKSPVANLYLK